LIATTRPVIWLRARVDLSGAAAAEHALDLVGVVEHLALAEDVAGQRVDHRHASVLSRSHPFCIVA
jgi:hypothetical protein